jgi:hypothetical protein
MPRLLAVAGFPTIGPHSRGFGTGHNASAVFAERSRRTLIAVCDGQDAV